MDRIALGATELSVAPVCVGTWQLSGAWGQDTSEARAAVRRAWRLGLNFIDTAYAYGFGAAETTLAEVLDDRLRNRRSELVIITKGGIAPDGTSYVRNSDPDFLRSALEDSLRRLGTDYVDIYLIHWPDPTVPLAETAGAVQGFVDAGLARYGGVSNFSVEQMREYGAHGPLHVTSVPHSVVRQEASDTVFPHCTEHRIGLLGHAPLAHGLLSGELRADTVFRPDDWRSTSSEFTGEGYRARIAVVDELRTVAVQHNCTVAELALAWVLAHPAGVIPVIGAERTADVDSWIRARSIQLPTDVVDRITRLGRSAEPLKSSGIANR